MKNIKTVNYISTIGAFFFLLFLPSHGEITLSISLLSEPAIEEQSFLSGRESFNKQTIRIGEPIMCRFILSNTSDYKTPALIASLRPEDGAHSIYIRRVGEKQTKVRTMRWEIRSRAILPRPLKAGEELYYETWLFGVIETKPDKIGRNRYFFEQPGQYEMFSTFVVRPGLLSTTESTNTNQILITSNVVSIDVKEPSIWEDGLPMKMIVDAVECGIDSSRLTKEQILQLSEAIVAIDNAGLSSWLSRNLNKMKQ